MDELGQQELKLKAEILDQYVFCYAFREPNRIRIALEEDLTGGVAAVPNETRG